MMTAVGVPFLFEGYELGMTDLISDSIDEMNDIQGIINYKTALAQGKSPKEALSIANESSRDKSRSPMQWDASPNAGFTTGKPWLKVNDNYKEVNAEEELLKTNSLLSTYIKLIELRKTEEVLSYGKYTNLSFKDGLLQFARTYRGHEIIVYISFDKNIEIDLPLKPYQVLYGCAKKNLFKNESLILKF